MAQGIRRMKEEQMPVRPVVVLTDLNPEASLLLRGWEGLWGCIFYIHDFIPRRHERVTVFVDSKSCPPTVLQRVLVLVANTRKAVWQVLRTRVVKAQRKPGSMIRSTAVPFCCNTLRTRKGRLST
jgi:hypothetical protein